MLFCPQIHHTSEIRITCVFGQPIAFVSYRPGDSEGIHDIMFDENVTRESSTRRVERYLHEIDKKMQFSEGIQPSEGGDSSKPKFSLWERMRLAASTIAKGTDFLRVDIFLDANSAKFWINEMDPT